MDTVIDIPNAKGTVGKTVPADNTTKKNKIVFSNLTKKQKDVLTTAGLGLAGLFAGGGIYAVMGFAKSEIDPTPTPSPTPSPTPTPTIPEDVIIYTNAPVAVGVNDEMSFGEAFKTARAEVGEGGVFEWKGQLYNTYTKEEWDAMSPAEQQEFADSIGNEAEIVIDDNTEEPAEDVSQAGTNEENENEQENEEAQESQEAQEYTITEEDIIASIDTNNDGNTDVYLVDVNDNGQVDIAIVNEEGKVEEVYLDYDPNASQEGQQVYEITEDDVIEQDNKPEDAQEVDINDIENNIVDVDLDPNFDNDVDMDEYA